MSVTTKEIAKICNVSRTTVTRALSGKGRISAQTKQYILDTARELGYQPDLMARGLVKGISMMIGVVLCDLKNMYFPNIIDAMEKIARENEYILNITLHGNDPGTEKNIISQLAGHRIDGLVLNPASSHEDDYGYLKDYPFPIVIIGGKKIADYPYVGNDEWKAANDAVYQIANKGYRSLYFVFPKLNGCQNSFVGHRLRLDGARQAARAAQMHFDAIGSDNYVQKAAGILKHSKEKTAFLCSGDLYAGYIMMEMARQGWTAGADYGIMGFDHLDLMKMFPRKLATVDNNIPSVGAKAMELLLDLIENAEKKETAKTIHIPYCLIEGETL